MTVASWTSTNLEGSDANFNQMISKQMSEGVEEKLIFSMSKIGNHYHYYIVTIMFDRQDKFAIEWMATRYEHQQFLPLHHENDLRNPRRPNFEHQTFGSFSIPY